MNKAKNPNSTHYHLWDGMESIDVIKKTLALYEYIGWLKGNILKYQLRMGKKDDIEKEKMKIKTYQDELNYILRSERDSEKKIQECKTKLHSILEKESSNDPFTSSS